MACLNPRILRNPSLHYVPGIDLAQITVPCGVCLGCQDDQRNEWSIRSYYEFLEAKKYNGFTYFCTLTYNNANLPYIDKVSSYDVHELCFNYNHIRTLIHSLRKAIKDKYGLPKEVFTYLVTCEYGGNNTKRPHYHPLFHFYTDRISPEWFLKTLTRLWHYGFVYPRSGNPDEGVVHDFKASKYVSKYICKDMNWYGKKSIQDLLYSEGSINRTVKSELSAYLPRHYQSKLYGSYLFNLLKGNSDAYQIIDTGIRPLLKNEVYRVPRYILNKLSYDFIPKFDSTTGEVLRDENGKIQYLRYLNQFGRKFKTWKLKNNVDKLAARFKHHFSYIGLLSRFSDKDIQEYTLNPNSSVLTFKGEIDKLLAGRSYRDLAIYCLCAKGRELQYSDLLPLYGIDRSPDNLYNYVLQNYFKFENVDTRLLPENEVPKDFLSQRILLDTVPLFNGMSAVLDLYNVLKNRKIKEVLSASDTRAEGAKVINNMFKPH